MRCATTARIAATTAWRRPSLRSTPARSRSSLDLKQPQDLATARRIVERCDVLVENFRPGVMARLGLGHEAMRALNPRHRLLLGLRLRPVRTATRLARHRQYRAGHQRHDEPWRRPGRATDARRLSGGRHAHRARPRPSRSWPRCCGGNAAVGATTSTWRCSMPAWPSWLRRWCRGW